MRRAARLDANHADVLAMLRDIPGCLVESCAAMGHGFPDIMVGFADRIIFLEVKDGSKPPSARKLTPAQERFHKSWGKYIFVVKDCLEAYNAVTLGVRANGKGS